MIKQLTVFFNVVFRLKCIYLNKYNAYPRCWKPKYNKTISMISWKKSVSNPVPEWHTDQETLFRYIVVSLLLFLSCALEQIKFHTWNAIR